MTTVTIRDVPDDVRDALATQARERGQSLQAHLLELLRQQARFARNRQILLEIAERFGKHGEPDDGGPAVAEVIRAARAEREVSWGVQAETR
jgi:plasmid stability protein